jgi:acetyltransferase-like isoleucine patch superfamily enzyme
MLRAARYAVAVLRARILFRLHGVRAGARPRVYGARPRLGGGGRITVGANCRIEGRQARCSLVAEPAAEIIVGDNAYFNNGFTLHAACRVVIGDDVRFGDGSAVYDTNFHEVAPGDGVRQAPVVISDGVWVARGAVILPGVVIGERSVIGANTVVTRSVPADCVVAGNPATIIRRFAAPTAYVRA